MQCTCVQLPQVHLRILVKGLRAVYPNVSSCLYPFLRCCCKSQDPSDPQSGQTKRPIVQQALDFEKHTVEKSQTSATSSRCNNRSNNRTVSAVETEAKDICAKQGREGGFGKTEEKPLPVVQMCTTRGGLHPLPRRCQWFIPTKICQHLRRLLLPWKSCEAGRR